MKPLASGCLEDSAPRLPLPGRNLEVYVHTLGMYVRTKRALSITTGLERFWP